MNEDEHSEDKKDSEQSSLERAEELYRLADIVVDALADSAAYDHQTAVSAKARFKKLIGDPSFLSSVSEESARHVWIIYVLEDMSRYAETERLHSLRDSLLHVKLQFREYLDATNELQQRVERKNALRDED